MLEEQLAILHGLWTEPDGLSYEGRHWQVSDALFYPKPKALPGRRHPNILIGGDGGPWMARLVAQYADEFNLTGGSLDRIGPAYGRVRAACADAGRDPGAVTYSMMTGVLVGRDEAEIERRVADLLVSFGQGLSADTREWLEARRPRWVMGTPDESAPEGKRTRGRRRPAADAAGLLAARPRDGPPIGRGLPRLVVSRLPEVWRSACQPWSSWSPLRPLRLARPSPRGRYSRRGAGAPSSPARR